MTWQKISVLTLLVCFQLSATIAHGQYRGSGLISQEAAQRVGLEVGWFTQVQLDSAQAEISDLNQFISMEEAETVFELQYQGRKELISENGLDAFGERMGVEGAEKKANLRVEILKAEGIEATIEKVVAPRITLYFSTSQALVHAIDGETGQTRWTTAVGSRRNPTLRVDVTENYLAVVNGSTLYCLNPKSGEILWNRVCRGAVGSGPGISNDFIFVPMSGGVIEAFKLRDFQDPTETYVSTGRVMYQPTVTENTISWPTDRGHLNVAYANKAVRSIRYRLEAGGNITSRAVFAAPDRLLVCSMDGLIHCISEVSGNIQWQLSTGDPISQSPIVIGEDVYAMTDYGEMYKLSLENGMQQWIINGVERFVSASDDRIHVMGKNRRLLILDRATGSVVGSLSTLGTDYTYVNELTDRILIGNRNGLIQCLHEKDLDRPLIHVELPDPSTEGEAKPKRGSGTDQPLTKPDAPVRGGGSDPFGGDPFGGGAGGDDPFGTGGSDPFGGGAGGDDPFGTGGDDPFGS